MYRRIILLKKISIKFILGFSSIISLLIAFPVFSQVSSHNGNIEFVENKNQWVSNVKFKADIPNGALFLENNCFTFVFKDAADLARVTEFKHNNSGTKDVAPDDRSIKCHAYKMNFINASGDVKIAGGKAREGYFNYFIGNDKSKWASHATSFGDVIYNDLYKNTDLHVYESNGSIKYDLLLHPGADPATIEFSYEGADKVYLSSGDLKIKTSVNEVTELSPVAFQVINGVHVDVKCKFKLEKNNVSFVFPDGYNKAYDLTIDPVLIFSTYTGSTIDNWGFTATFDNKGRVYSGGIAFGTGYPVSVGAYQVFFGGGELGAYLNGCDVAIIKYDSSGTQRLYATYLGGSRNDLPHSMIVNESEELVIYGTTGSDNFPVTTGAYDLSFNGGDAISYDYNSIQFSYGIDIFVSKLSSDGTQLLASTYVGGTKNDGMNYPSPILSKNYADGARGEIMTDKNNNVYVVSTTNSVDFPVTSGVFQQNSGGGGQDAVVFKMDAGLSNMIWSSYLGGSGADAAYSIIISNGGSLYVTGGTTSTDFPVTPLTLHTSYIGGTSDGFITRISPNGSSILRSSYFGSNVYDQSYRVQKDQEGKIYLYGQTDATGNTLIYNAAWNTPGGGQFVSKISSGLDTLIWSTAFGTGGGGPDISPNAFLVDYCDKIYMSGWGGPSLNGFGGTAGLPVTFDAFQNTTDDHDYYFLVISDDASSLIYATYFGSPNSAEHVDGGTSRFDRKGRIYQGVCAGCGGWDDFPTTPGAWSNTNNSSNCNNGVIKFDFMLPIVIADFDIPPVVCAPEIINFHNTSSASGTTGISYQWTFGDGTGSTAVNPSHLYNTAGIYDVKLVVNDTGSCNRADSITQQVIVLADSTWSLADTSVCLSDFIQIGILPLPDPSLTYQWIPSTGLSNDTIPNPIAAPLTSTNYMLLISNGVCVDTLFQQVNVVSLNVDAGNDINMCSGDTTLTATYTGSPVEFIWSHSPYFTDTLNFPLSSNTVNVSPSTSTSYYVMASNLSCFKIDSVHVNITEVKIQASPNFSICVGDTTNISVTNLVPLNPLSYQWSPLASIISGANSSAASVDPSVTTTYTVVATDSTGCQKSDTVVVQVSNLSTMVVTDSVNCFGNCDGSATLTANNGFPPYTYSWSGGQTTPTINSLCSGLYLATITDNVGCKHVLTANVSSPLPLNASVSNYVMVDCDSTCDGSATLTVSGGTPAYHYQWIDGQSAITADSLCAGSYTVTISDYHGCSTSLTATIDDSSNFYVSIDSIVTPSCANECDAIAFALATGGLPPYTYNWDNGDIAAFSDSLCNGSHSLTVYENSGCIRNVFYTITNPTVVTSAITGLINPSCYGLCNGQISVNASGGTGPYTYNWSSGQNGPVISSICDGQYVVEVYDSHNCYFTDTIFLPEPTPLIISATASTVPCVEVCNGIASAVSSGSSPPYSYHWSNGFNGNPATNLCPGSYTVTVTDNNLCQATDTVIVVDSILLPPSFNAFADDTTIYLTQSTGLHATHLTGFIYSWQPVTGLDDPSSADPVATPNSTTTYVVTIEDPYGCIYYDTVIVKVLDVLCNESEIFVPNAFTPNYDGNNDKLFVRSHVLKSIYFVIYDRWGEKVFETTDLSLGWDGTYKGRKCDPGVFDYYMKAICLGDTEIIKKGNITLIR